MAKNKSKIQQVNNQRQVRASNLTAGLLAKTGVELPKQEINQSNSNNSKHHTMDQRSQAMQAAAALVAKNPNIVWLARGIFLILIAVLGLALYGAVSYFTSSDKVDSKNPTEITKSLEKSIPNSTSNSVVNQIPQ